MSICTDDPAWVCGCTSCPWETKNRYTSQVSCDPGQLRDRECICNIQFSIPSPIIDRYLYMTVNPCYLRLRPGEPAYLTINVIRRFPSIDLLSKCAYDVAKVKVRIVNLDGIEVWSRETTIIGEDKKTFRIALIPSGTGQRRYFVELWLVEYRGQPTLCIDRQEIKLDVHK